MTDEKLKCLELAIEIAKARGVVCEENSVLDIADRLWKFISD